MKKTLDVILALLMVISVFPMGIVTAIAATSGDYTYTVTDSKATITAYSGTGGDITIPDNLDGYPVVNIGVSAFRNNRNITGVVIQSGLVKIGNFAFNGCTKLTNINIPVGVTSIGKYAFQDCYALSGIIIPNTIKGISYYAFRNSGLTSVSIPNSVESIGTEAFSGCSYLSSVVIPGSVKSIGEWAFLSCTTLSVLTMESGITDIKGGAFQYCSGLSNVTIPGSVTSISVDAFTGTAWLNNYADDFVIAGDGVLIKYKGSAAVLTVPNTVKSIGWDAFKNSATLTGVTIPSSVTNIGPSAFGSCSNLSSVTIPNSVTSIGSSAFGGTPWQANYPSDFVIAGDGILISYKGTSSNLSIPDGVKVINDFLFNRNTSLTRVTIPSSVTSIGIEAFNGCTNLFSVTIPSSVKSIGKGAFIGTSWLDRNGSDFMIVGDGVLLKCSSPLSAVTIPNGVKSIGYNVFWMNTGLKSIEFPSSLTSIGDWAFSFCTGLTSIILPSGVTSIGNYAFYACSSLVSIVASAGITAIANDWAFSSTGDLTVACPAGSYIDKFAQNNGYNTITNYSILVFDANGGNGGTTMALPAGTALTAPAVTKTGYTLAGWSPIVPPTAPSADTTYTAQWTANTYTICYDGNGNTSGSTLDSVHTYDVYANLTANGFVRTGYSFLGWSRYSTSSSAAYTNSQSVKNQSSTQGAIVTFFAVWSANYYTITFDANGGTGGTSSSIKYGSTLNAPSVAKTGFNFIGWSPEVSSTVPAYNATYTAQWALAEYMITFDANGGTGDTSGFMQYGTALTAPAVTREAYTFIGWSPEVPPTVPPVNTTYTAQWALSSNNVTLLANGGIGGTSFMLEFGSPITPPQLSREGCIFTGWLPALPSAVVNGINTYEAQWIVSDYMITFDADGGIGGTSNLLRYGATLTAPVVTKTGYTFTGWSPEVPATVPGANTVYVAQWSMNPVEITFDANGGTGGTIGVMACGDPLKPPAVTREGYIFTGWLPAVPTQVVTGNQTYIATWMAVS